MLPIGRSSAVNGIIVPNNWRGQIVEMMYPYEEDKAGKLRDRHETGKPGEALQADDQVISLAKELLNDSLYLEAESLAEMLTGPRSEKASARVRLITILQPPPKRPIYYLPREIRSLPHWTRNAMRFLGDFIDMLVKASTYEKMGDEDIFRSSLGPAIGQFKKAFPKEEKLVDWLMRYNRFLYRDAKHDMDLPATRKEHRFTSREVVLCIFVTKELADRLTLLSEFALRVRQDKPIPKK